MKKLIGVILAPNDFGVLFDLNGERISNNGIIHVVEKDSYSELMRGNEREGVLVYMSKKEYEELKKQKKID
jgi:hypothetical protein